MHSDFVVSQTTDNTLHTIYQAARSAPAISVLAMLTVNHKKKRHPNKSRRTDNYDAKVAQHSCHEPLSKPGSRILGNIIAFHGISRLYERSDTGSCTVQQVVTSLVKAGWNMGVETSF